MPNSDHACTPPDGTPPCAGIRVLLVEDNPINCKVMARYCQRLGCEVVMTANGIEALHALADAPFDIVLTDIHMPDMDGEALTRAIRCHEAPPIRNLPVLVISSSSDPEDFIRYREAGADGSIPKPFELEQLEEALQFHARGNRQTGRMPMSIEAEGTRDIPLDTLPIFDEATARRYTLQNEPFLRKLLKEFDAGFSTQLAQMDTAIEAGNPDGLKTIAHRCKGASGSIAAPQIYELCVRLERACRGQHPPERASRIFSDLREAYARFRTHMEAAGWLDPVGGGEA